MKEVKKDTFISASGREIKRKMKRTERVGYVTCVVQGGERKAKERERTKSLHLHSEGGGGKRGEGEGKNSIFFLRKKGRNP